MNEELFEAIRENNLERVSELIAAGVDVNQIHKYYTPLIYAIVRRNFNPIIIIRELITAGADVNMFMEIPNTESRGTPLMYAVTTGNVEIVRALINAGADVNFKNHKTHDDNALNKIFQDYSEEHIIYDNGRITENNIIIIMDMLLDAGANVNEQGFHKTTPLMNVCTAQDIGVPPNHSIFDKKIFINALLERGANINLQDKYGNTALMMTIGMLDKGWINNYKTIIIIGGIFEEDLPEQIDLYKAHFVDLFKFLLSKGANIFIENNKGETALDIAIEVDNKEIIDILTRLENKEKKRIATDAYMRGRDISYTEIAPLIGFYNSKIDEPDYIMQQVLNMAYGEDEEGAEESKSNRDAGGRKKSKTKRKKSKSKRKSRTKRIKSRSKRRKSVRKKSKSKRRKSVRK